MLKWFKPGGFVLLVTLLFHLGGCSGSGGTPAGNGGGSVGPPPVPPVTPPAVLSTTPASGAASLVSDTAISATFSKEMEAASLNPSTFKIGGVTGTVTYREKTAFFSPADDLSPFTTYTAVITHGAKDTEGNPLPSDYSWRFHTGGLAEPSHLRAAPPSLTFLAADGGPIPPPQNLTFSSPDLATFDWSITDDAPWLTESPLSGTSSTPAAVSVNTTRLPPGTYTAAITVTPSGTQEASETVPVSYTIASSSPPAACSGPMRAPYIAFDTPASVTLAWECGPQGTVEWGIGSALTDRKEDALPSGNKHFVTLSPLSPDARYTYRVSVNGGLLGQGSFRTAKAAGDNTFRFAALGDTGTGSTAQFALASLIERIDPSFVLLVGDVIYDSGEEAEFDPHYFIPYRKLIDHLPFFPVAGNHDLRADKGATFKSNFYHPAGNLYYDFHWGDAHFIALDSTNADDPRQMPWLQQTLSSSTATWKIVYFHHPAYSSGQYGGYRYIQDHFVPLFEQYHVDLVFTAHDHDYERTLPRNGVTYLVTGGGGADLRAVGQNSFTAFSRSIHHLIQGEMTPHTLTLSAVDSNGTPFDSVTLTK